MAVSRSRQEQETSAATSTVAPVATVTTPVSAITTITNIRESATYGCRRSSFSSDSLPLQQSPLSPHGAAEKPAVVEKYSSPPQQPPSGRSVGSQNESTQNLASAAAETEKWDLSIQRLDGNTITFQVHVPASAPVGLWNCWIQTHRNGQRDNRQDYKCDEDIYILFNPWCREDTVYMDNDSSRQEYVLNEQGKIWSGTWRQPKGRKWIFGQFDDVVLPACVYLLERSGLEHSERGNPVRVTRAISAMVSL